MEDCNLHLLPALPSRSARVCARAGRRVRVPAAAAVQYAHAERRLRGRLRARRRRREAPGARVAGAARTRGPRRRRLAAALRVVRSVRVPLTAALDSRELFLFSIYRLYSYCLDALTV